MSQMIFTAMMLPAASLAVCAVLTAAVRTQAVRRSFVARPQHDRYHQSIVALGEEWRFLDAGPLYPWRSGSCPLCDCPGHLDGWLSLKLLEHTDGFLDPAGLLVVLGVAAVLPIGFVGRQKHLGPFSNWRCSLPPPRSQRSGQMCGWRCSSKTRLLLPSCRSSGC